MTGPSGEAGFRFPVYVSAEVYHSVVPHADPESDHLRVLAFLREVRLTLARSGHLDRPDRDVTYTHREWSVRYDVDADRGDYWLIFKAGEVATRAPAPNPYLAAALADGSLVNVTAAAREAGHASPVYMTETAYHAVVPHRDLDDDRRRLVAFLGSVFAGGITAPGQWEVDPHTDPDGRPCTVISRGPTSHEFLSECGYEDHEIAAMVLGE